MVSLLDTVFLKQQKSGPNLNLILAVVATEGLHNVCNDTLKTQTISVDDKVEFFLKFNWITITNNDNKLIKNLDMYMGVTKQETNNSSVGVTITCNEFKKYVECTNKLIEINMGNNGWTFKIPVGSLNSILFYKLEMTITVKEVCSPMNNRLYDDTEFTDFQLHAPDGTVAVHKAMLAVQSDMLKTMLRGVWKETAEGRIKMEGVTVLTLQHLKDYMYLGTLPDESSDLIPLLQLADHYLMEKLKSDCVAKLVTSVEPENFEEILQFACQGSPSTELVRALVFQVPDYVRNSAKKVKINEINDQK